MTRINLVNPDELTDQHLIAELRELPRIFTHVRKHGISKNIPKTFCLGKGHVLFFTDKIYFLTERLFKLMGEAYCRGFKVSSIFHGIYYDMSKYCMYKKQTPHWKPSIDDIIISNNRLNEKIALKPNWYKKTTWKTIN